MVRTTTFARDTPRCWCWLLGHKTLVHFTKSNFWWEQKNRQLNFGFYGKVLYTVLQKVLRCNKHQQQPSPTTTVTNNNRHQQQPSPLDKRRTIEWVLTHFKSIFCNNFCTRLMESVEVKRRVGWKGLRSYVLLHSTAFGLQNNIPCPWFPITKVQRAVSSTQNQFHHKREEYIVYFLML